MPTSYGGGGMATYAGTTKPKPKPLPYTVSPKLPAGTSTTVAGTSLPWYMNPSANARPDTQYWWQPDLDQSRTLTPAEQSAKQMALVMGAQPGTVPQNPLSGLGPGGGGRGGGGGGGAAAATGLDQATLDWLFGQLGMGKPKQLQQTTLDLPDPSQFYGKFDTSQYDVARQGVQQGIQGIQQRGNQAFDNAQTELNQYRNPYGTGLQASNPDQYAAMQRMAEANGATGALQDVNYQGQQADRAFGNVQALLAANDQARSAANNRALAGDRQTMDTNLGLEGNMLNLGVNMGQARGQSSWDQMVKQAQYEAAQQEAAQNWQRGNTVSDQNVGNLNQWNQGLFQQLLAMVGAKAPGTTLPADTGGWYGYAS